ncbi:MAG: hypothetical protein KDK36_19985 [Leptospiraceae bacterium]|nr:hypothetical protein [Leptospiraceae bacterium]
MKLKYLLIAYFLISIIALEALLDIYFSKKCLFVPHSEELVYSLKPKDFAISQSDEFYYSINTNSLGSRQNGVSKQKFDAIFLGSFLSEGIGVQEKEIYVNRLNRSLGYKYLNLGNHKLSPITYILYLNKFLEEYPVKEIFIELNDKDLLENKISREKITFANNLPLKAEKNIFVNLIGVSLYNKLSSLNISCKLRDIFNNSELINYYKITKSPPDKILSQKESLIINNGKKTLFGNYEKPLYENFNQIINHEIELNKSYFSTILQLSKEKNLKINLIYIPSLAYYKECDNCKSNVYISQIKEICKKNNLNCFFLNEKLSNEQVLDYYFPGAGVLNKYGHEYLAKQLELYLKGYL